MRNRPGRHFLQIPGPTNVPGRVLEAIGRPTIDHRGPEFAALGRACLDGMRRVFRTNGRIYVFPSSGTGAWEAALVNTLSPGDRVLVYETGHFARLWSEVARAPRARGGDARGRLAFRSRSRGGRRGALTGR